MNNEKQISHYSSDRRIKGKHEIQAWETKKDGTYEKQTLQNEGLLLFFKM